MIKTLKKEFGMIDYSKYNIVLQMPSGKLHCIPGKEKDDNNIIIEAQWQPILVDIKNCEEYLSFKFYISPISLGRVKDFRSDCELNSPALIPYGFSQYPWYYNLWNRNQFRLLCNESELRIYKDNTYIEIEKFNIKNQNKWFAVPANHMYKGLRLDDNIPFKPISNEDDIRKNREIITPEVITKIRKNWMGHSK